MSIYAARIRAARAYARLTQSQLAERLGVDVQTVKRREAGGRDPARGELLAIAAICGVPAAFMEDGFGEPGRDELLDRLDQIQRALEQGLAPDGASPLGTRKAPRSRRNEGPQRTQRNSRKTQR